MRTPSPYVKDRQNERKTWLTDTCSERDRTALGAERIAVFIRDMARWKDAVEGRIFKDEDNVS